MQNSVIYIKVNELDRRIECLIDTGSDLTLINEDILGKDVLSQVNPEERTLISGLATLQMSTKGTIEVTFNLNSLERQQKCQVVPKCPHDCILGRDFLKASGAVIDFRSNSVKIGNESFSFAVKNVRVGTLRVYVPARCERIVQLSTISEGVGLVAKCELAPGVYLGNSLTKAKDGKCVCSIVNTNENEVEIEVPSVKLEKYQMYKTENKVGNIGTRRDEILESLLRLDHLHNKEKETLIKLCKDFSDIFHLPGDKLTYTDTIQHSIPVSKDVTPINVKPYRIPEAHKEEVKHQEKQMLENDIIEPSLSPWNAPILVIPKKLDASGQPKWRVVVDYRKLNEVSIGTVFPIPCITEILDQLGQAKYFTTLDLASGYLQVRMDKNDQEKTAFSTTSGHYQMKRMMFGLKGAPATFSRLMNTVLSGLVGIKCLVYLDDVVIYGQSVELHNERLREVFERLRLHNLKLQPDKCEFLRKEVSYLGHVISDEGVKPDPAKVEKVYNYPRPRNAKEIKMFCGLASYYRRFIPKFSHVAKPLYNLVKKEVTFKWEDEQERAFQTLKNVLTSEQILQYPDFSKLFLLTTDASQLALGAILSQGELGKDKPVAYASRTLNKAEQNYSTTEREMLAIVWAVKHFRPYLLGRHFVILTDHKPLQYVFGVKDPSSRLLKWRLKLEEYSYEIRYRAGKTITHADALSRIPKDEIKETNLCEVSNKTEVESESKPGVKEEDKVSEMTPEEKQRIIKEFHDTPVGGHQGMNRTYERIKQYATWVGMKNEIEAYIRKCDLCQRNKLTKPHIKMPLEITDTPESVWEKCSMDIVGPLVESNEGNKYLLTFQDLLSKYTVAVPLADQSTESVAKAFVNDIILKFGIPEKLLTDQGSNFTSELFRKVCKMLGISKLKTSSYHPQSNGAIERWHRSLAEFLRHFVANNQGDWDQWVNFATFVHNTTPHVATGFAPHVLMFGRLPNVPGSLQKEPVEVNYNYEDYLKMLKVKLQETYKLARSKLVKAKEISKINYDKNANVHLFEPGDKVLLYDETVRRGRSRKLCSKYIGPYVVKGVEGVNVILLRKGKKDIKVHTNRLKPYF